MRLLILSDAAGAAKAVLPSLEFLDHTVATAPLSPESLNDAGGADLLLVDGTADIAAASHVCRQAAATDIPQPLVLVLGGGGLAAVKSTWGFDEWLLQEAEPAEVETRLRLSIERAADRPRDRPLTVGELTIDEATYVVRLRGTPLNLTFREFELLHHLVANTRIVFTREQLLQTVWGFDYFGGTRTVDVHIRRLRAKLGPEYEQLIVTVRGVGYKLDPQGLEGGEKPTGGAA